MGKISKIFTFQGMNRVPAEQAVAGDIVAIAGISDIYVGETIAGNADVEPLPGIKVDPPSLSMNFMVNNSPFAGKEGKFVPLTYQRMRT